MESTPHDQVATTTPHRDSGMTQEDIVAFMAGLPGVMTVIGSAESGTPEISWGDTFFMYDPEGTQEPRRRMPFATVVTKDYPGFDTASDLDRPGVFRLNIDIGRAAFEELIGYPPAAYAERAAHIDHTVLDRLVPHPAYARQGWVAVLNPGAATSALVRTLLTDAHARIARTTARTTQRRTGSQERAGS
ncbi:DUF6194 family protein [Streptomyces sp. MST-110588]|uniref:DUF6194 family protein n=1 Tax=Streptomyces sp. MST-110588 TaxID=2833628 RepID=UPI001F5D8C56|nr:DUF6194 family protein [Streptomyces sp. MST-110588]UNO41201.1 hypothetical protein KGS77_18505 [Streptomyces sp. MST-110588]